MQTEYEITFQNINHTSLREKIQELGATCIQGKTLMKRVIFKQKGKEGEKEYFRVRDEGNKITCTYKKISDGKLTIHSVKEIETQISDFEAMKYIFSLSGLKQIAYQESYRETWKIGLDIEFMLDEWPGIKPFLEIEGKNEDIVQEYCRKLGLDYEKGVFGAIDELYHRELGFPHSIINQMPEITFNNPPLKYTKS